VIQPDGKIVLACWYGQFVVARFNANGTTDSSFGSGGEVTTQVGNTFGGVALQVDGKIVVGGGQTIAPGATDLCLVRYNADGTLDTTFGSSDNGVALVPPPSGYSTAGAGGGVEIQSDGKIVASGEPGPGGGVWSATRVNADGTLDTSYGNGGWATVVIGYADNVAASALQPDGRLLLAGWERPTSSGNPRNAVLIRILESAPHIGSFTANPNPVVSGSNVTLTASNITDGNPNSTITQVTFCYFDANGNQVVLGTGTKDSSGNWALTLAINSPSGTYTLYAQAQDNYGEVGNIAALSLQVQ
jgi:uncharacterized delta-60 repeat protein